MGRADRGALRGGMALPTSGEGYVVPRLWVERGGLRVDSPIDTSLPQMRRIAQRFASLPLDLADASIAEAAERLGLRNILSVDADFDVYRDGRGRPLTNLLNH